MNLKFMTYFIVNLILLVISVFPAISMDDYENQICVYNNSSEEYKEFVKNYEDSEKWNQELINFCKKGEFSAVMTATNWDILNVGKEKFLRDLAKDENPAAYFALADILSQKGEKECLDLYKEAYFLNRKLHPDLRLNYATSLLKFHENDVKNLRQGWDFIGWWIEKDLNPNSEKDLEALLAIYEYLFQKIKELKDCQLFLTVVDAHKSNEKIIDFTIRGLLSYSFEGTSFIDLLFMEKGVTLTQPNENETQNDYFSRITKEKNYFSTRKDKLLKVIPHNIQVKLIGLLKQNKDLMKFPENYFKNFDRKKMNEEQQQIWSRKIIQTSRLDLLKYTQDDMCLKYTFGTMDNVNLEKHVIHGLKNMFM